ncbi:hypothetical protein SDC9_195501 [bioreactor metagenome]|uniref:Uncharacterized protein n=1 Tax=bioreactor metagenome TaxID=1076179 RepID=A0A645I981_9ZZZZ
MPGLGIARDTEGRIAVVARDLHRPLLPFHAGKRGQRHLLALGIGHIQAQQGLGRHARGRVGLHHHALQAPGIRKLVDHGRAIGRGQHGTDAREAYALGLGLAPVYVQTQLRRVFEVLHHCVGDHRRGIGLLQQLVARGDQGLAAQIGAVLQTQRKTA